MKNFQYAGLENGTRVVITEGKHTGVVCTVLDTAYSSKITLLPVPYSPASAGEQLVLAYSKVELAGPDDRPVIEPVRDMTGREITDGSWVVYSVTIGSHHKHGLELGKVEEITAIGGLKVARILQNGEKIANRQYSWEKREFRHVHDADRVITLPCDVATMTEWVLKDFEDLKDQLL